MRYILWSIVALLLCATLFLLCHPPTSTTHITQNTPTDIITKTLPNGLEIAVQKTASNSVILMCFIKSGSIHEEEYLGSGISHYLEHLVSSGTTSYRTEAQYRELEKEIGAITNAFTTYETTAFHIQVEPEHFDTALQVLYEQMTAASLTQREVDREKEVILKEMILRSSPPGMQAYQRRSEVFESNTHYRYPTIGYPEQFSKITRNDLLKYYNRHFTPDNMVFVVVGAVEPDTAISKVESTFASLIRKPKPFIYQPSQPVPSFQRTVMEEFDIEDEALVVMYRPIDVNKPQDKFAIDIAQDILYGKRTSPIAYYLTEEHQLASYIYAYTEFTPSTKHASMETIIGVPNPDDIEKVLALHREKLLEYSKPNTITQKMIDTAIKRYESEEYLGHSHSADIEDIAGDIGDSIISYGVPNSSKLAIAELRKVTIADVQRVIGEYLLSNHITFYTLPRGASQLFASEATADAEKSDITRIELSDRLTLLHKYSSAKPTVRGVIYLPIGERYETAENIGIIEAVVDLLLSGSKKYPSLALSDWLEDRNIRVWGSGGRDGINITFNVMNTDILELTDIIADAFANPLFTENDLEMWKINTQAHYNWQLSYPQARHEEFLYSTIFTNDKYKLTIRERLELLQQLTQQDIIDAYKKYFTADKMVVSLLGDISADDARQFARTVASKMPNKPINEAGTPPTLAVSGSTYTNNYNFEQTNITFSMTAPFSSSTKGTPERKEFITMRLIEAIFDNPKGLSYAVRGDNDLAYFVFTSYIYSRDYGTLRIETQTSLEKKERLMKVIEAELKKMTTAIIPKTEITEAIEYMVKMRNTYYDDESLQYSALDYETKGLGYDFFNALQEEMLEITGEDIRNVAQKYLSKFDVIISQPGGDVQ